jgi:hypothetical protein
VTCEFCQHGGDAFQLRCRWLVLAWTVETATAVRG